MTDVATQLLHGLQTIAHRHPRPRPFLDIGSLPWDDPAFSRHFLRTATRSQRYTHREMAFLEERGLLRPGQRILDMACGGGRHSLAMARRGALVTGIDLGPAAIAAGGAVDFAIRESLPNVSAVRPSFVDQPAALGIPVVNQGGSVRERVLDGLARRLPSDDPLRADIFDLAIAFLDRGGHQ